MILYFTILLPLPQYHSVGGHTFGYCSIPHYNLTIVNWFLYGMADDEDYSWFASNELRPLTFERRFDEVMLPLMEAEGLGGPDLIIEVSWKFCAFKRR